MSHALTLVPSILPFKIKFRLGLNRGFFYMASLVSIVLLFAWYIFQVNSLAREKYLLEDYEQKVSQFSRANETLEVNFSKTNSLVNADKYLASQIFEKTTKIKYIQLLEDQVVTR